MTLLNAKKGIPIKIVGIPCSINRAKLIRFGIGEGSVVEAEKIGSVIIIGNVCIGRNLAKRITVKEVV